MEFIACPAHRKNIPASACCSCEHQDTVVGCKHFSRVVPVEYCTRICAMQKAQRSGSDPRTGVATILGEIKAPIAPGAHPLCGAPWVLAQWGTPRPIFAGAPEPAIEDPATNVARGCRFPRALKSREENMAIPKGLEV